MLSATSTFVLAVLAVCVTTTIYRRVTRFSIKYIRGPPGSFWLGTQILRVVGVTYSTIDLRGRQETLTVSSGRKTSVIWISRM